MRLRFLPWVWENIVLSWQSSEETFVNNLNTVANALHADKYVATSVKYFYTFPYPWLGTDPCLMKVHDGVFHVGFYHVLSVRRMPKVPPKSPHAIDRICGRLSYDPTRGRA